MALGMTPLIPLNRVVPDPNARFERFGQNDAQLFGKPMISAGGLSLLTQAASAAYTAFKADGPDQPAAAPAPTAALTAPLAGAPGTGTPAIGSYLDFKA